MILNYYSAIGMLALLILLIENQDVLLNRNDAFSNPAWKVYRRFLFAVLVYYVTDITWGILESYKLSAALFADTTVYFIAMAVGVLFWTQYTVTYLEEDHPFGNFLLYTGRAFAAAVLGLVILNIFTPILFTVDKDCVYQALFIRYIILAFQIALLLMISAYAFRSIVRGRHMAENGQRYRTLGMFGLIMAIFLFAQLWDPYLPLYAIAYLLGTSLLRAFVIGDEKEGYRKKVEEAFENARSSGTVYSRIAQTLARGYMHLFYIDLETGDYVEYHTDKENGKAFEARRGSDFFESCQLNIRQLIYPDDREMLANALEERKLKETLDRNDTLIMTYRVWGDNGPVYASMNVSRMEDDSRYAIMGVMDVDEEMKQRRAAEQIREEHAAYARISALSGEYLSLHVVDPETDRYRLCSANPLFKSFGIPEEGEDFFTLTRELSHRYVHPEDLDRYMQAFTKENVLAEIGRTGLFALTYRLIAEDEPVFVRLKCAAVEETDGRKIIVGINDVDDQVRQEEEYAQRLRQAQTRATVDALTGVRNKYAYLDAETELDRQMEDPSRLPFAIIVLDVNDLKKTNDTAGHQAGDKLLRDACRIICQTFKHSPVFRIGGDEFAVIARGHDYEHLGELTGKIDEHNRQAAAGGGPVIACGAAECTDDTSVAAVFKRADTAMYENKRLLKETGGAQ